MDDPANAPGDAEKRLGLLVMPLRDLWKKEEAGGLMRPPPDSARLGASHLEAALPPPREHPRAGVSRE